MHISAVMLQDAEVLTAKEMNSLVSVWIPCRFPRPIQNLVLACRRF